MGGGFCEVLLRSADTCWRKGGKYSHRTTQAISKKQLKAFMVAVKVDEGLQEELKAAKDTDDVSAIANEAGFIFSADELELAQELSEDDEREAVSGGRKREVQSRQPCPSTTQFIFPRPIQTNAFDIQKNTFFATLSQ